MCHFRAKSLLAVLFTSPMLHAQTSTSPRFDVVSVKLSVPGADPLKHGLLRVTTPDRVRYLGINLKALMMTAYGLEEYQVVAPDWMGMTDVDIEATMSVGTTAAQLRVMFQNLLLDRFKLTFHWDTKELPVYSMVVGKGGPKMSEVGDGPSSGGPPPSEAPLKLDEDGFPVAQGSYRDGLGTFRVNGRSLLRGQRATMQDLAKELSSKLQLGRPVTDETALSGKYNFTLKFTTPGWNGRFEDIPELGISASAYEAMAPLPELAAALRSQLGLKLEQKREPVEMFVVDRVEKAPTAN